MIFSEDFLEYLRSNPIDGAVKLVEIARDNLVVDSPDWQNEDYPILLEAYALLMEVNESGLLSINLPLFDITGQKDRDCTAINNLFEIVISHCVSESSRLKIEYMRSHFRTALGAGFAYEFSQGDLTRLQDLISHANSNSKCNCQLVNQFNDLPPNT